MHIYVKNLCAIAGICGLTGCALPPPAPLIDLPARIDDAIPSDIDRSEVNRDQDGCYFYVYAGSLFQVTDSAGNHLCVES